MTPNRAKTYDFRANWVKCREAQHQFDVMWKREKAIERIMTLKMNLPMYTKKKRGIFICTYQSPNYVIAYLQGCARLYVCK